MAAASVLVGVPRADTIPIERRYTDLNRGWGLNPVALGASWMAYSSSAHVDPRTMTPVAGSAGGRDPVAKLMGMAQKTGTDLWCVTSLHPIFRFLIFF